MKRPTAIRKWGARLPFSGFTLVELIVVITILAILATIGFLSLSGYSQDAKDSVIKANVRSLQVAIASESALTGNSPRYYVVHDPDYALSGAFAYVDGISVALTGGDVGSAPADSNYTAGRPDFKKLKLNPDKFKISASWLSGGTFGVIARATGLGTDSAEASFDTTSLMAAGADFQVAGVNGRKRTVSYSQAAGISPSTKLASVTGNFPTTNVPAGNVSGLFRAEPGSTTNLTGALVDGGTGSGTIGCTTNCPVNMGTIAQLTYGVTGPTYAYTSTTRTSGKTAAFANVGINQGKWYFELTLDDNYSSNTSALYDIGFSNKPSTYTATAWFAEATTADNFWGYIHPGSSYFCQYTHCGTNMANTSGVITAFTAFWKGDVIGIAVDANAKTVSWYKNGTLAWTTTGITTPTPWYPGISSSYAPTATGVPFNFGQSAFAYPVPSWYNPGLWTAAQ